MILLVAFIVGAYYVNVKRYDKSTINFYVWDV